MTDERTEFDDREFRLSRYLDGDLDAAETARLERDLAGDPKLCAELEGYRRTEASLKATAGTVPDGDWEHFSQRVLWRCRAEELARPRRSFVRWIAPLAAAACLLAAFTLYWRATKLSEPRMMAQVDVLEPALPTGPAEIRVVFERTSEVTTPETESTAGTEPQEEEGSYVIAAAGALPFDDVPSSDEATPTF